MGPARIPTTPTGTTARRRRRSYGKRESRRGPPRRHGQHARQHQIYTAAGLDEAATLRGFQRAVAILDRVVVGEIQGGGPALRSISQPLTRRSTQVLPSSPPTATSGRTSSTVRSPGNAHRAIGVGNVDVQTQHRRARGGGRRATAVSSPTSRLRETPRRRAMRPTRHFKCLPARRERRRTRRARPCCCATSCAAGRDHRSRAGVRADDPVRARCVVRQHHGNGVLRLPTNGFAFVGNVDVGHKQNVDIPIPVGRNPRDRRGPVVARARLQDRGLLPVLLVRGAQRH